MLRIPHACFHAVYGWKKKKEKRHRKERSRDENVRGIRRFEKVLEKVSSNDFFHIWKWILDDN